MVVQKIKQSLLFVVDCLLRVRDEALAGQRSRESDAEAEGKHSNPTWSTWTLPSSSCCHWKLSRRTNKRPQDLAVYNEPLFSCLMRIPLDCPSRVEAWVRSQITFPQLFAAAILASSESSSIFWTSHDVVKIQIRVFLLNFHACHILMNRASDKSSPISEHLKTRNRGRHPCTTSYADKYAAHHPAFSIWKVSHYGPHRSRKARRSSIRLRTGG